MYVVEYYRLTVTWRLGQADVSWDDRFEDLRAKIAPKVGGDLLREDCPVVVHCEQDSLDLECRVDFEAQPLERVEKLGNTFEGEIFALNGD